MTKRETLIKKGWEGIIESERNLMEYSRLAGNWRSCAVGEIFGFPRGKTKSVIAAVHLPDDIYQMGVEFGHCVDHGDAKGAKAYLDAIQQRKNEIVEVYNKYY